MIPRDGLRRESGSITSYLPRGPSGRPRRWPSCCSRESYPRAPRTARSAAVPRPRRRSAPSFRRSSRRSACGARLPRRRRSRRTLARRLRAREPARPRRHRHPDRIARRGPAARLPRARRPRRQGHTRRRRGADRRGARRDQAAGPPRRRHARRPPAPAGAAAVVPDPTPAAGRDVPGAHGRPRRRRPHRQRRRAHARPRRALTEAERIAALEKDAQTPARRTLAFASSRRCTRASPPTRSFSSGGSTASPRSRTRRPRRSGRRSRRSRSRRRRGIGSSASPASAAGRPHCPRSVRRHRIPASARRHPRRRAQLGAAPDKTELAPYLSSKDPAIRSAAVRALAGLQTPAVGRSAATPPPIPTRTCALAAIEALGDTKQPATIPTLTQTFCRTIARSGRRRRGR